jgi:hypothetical protein
VRRDRLKLALAVVTAVLVLLGLGTFLAGFHAIALGIGDKYVLDLAGLELPRKITYQLGMYVGLANLALMPILLAGRRIVVAVGIPLLVAANVGLLARWAGEAPGVLERVPDQSRGDARAFTEPPRLHLGPDDIRRLIDVRTPAKAEARRRALIGAIWKRDALDLAALPDRIETGLPRPDALRDSASLAGVERWSADLPHGFRAVLLRLRPARSIGRAMLYHHGHEGDAVAAGRVLANPLLDAGFDVVAIAMPGLAPNVAPDYLPTPRLGPLPNRFGHGGYRWMETESFSPLMLFLHPVLAAVNQLTREGFERIDMAGLSGGGWTATVYAAVDPRIRKSFPVVGTLPLFLLGEPPNRMNMVDWEYTAPALLRSANYLEMYALGSSGPGRRQIQIHNQFDGCCFRGVGARLYAPLVAEAVSDLGQGGSYELVILPEHGHRIAPEAVEIILREARAD